MNALLVAAAASSPPLAKTCACSVPVRTSPCFAARFHANEDASQLPQADRIVHSLEDACATNPDFAIIASPAPFHIDSALTLASPRRSRLRRKANLQFDGGIDELIHSANRASSF